MKIEEMREILEKATPGPWTWDDDTYKNNFCWKTKGINCYDKTIMLAEDYTIEINYGDFEFIILALNNFDKLLKIAEAAKIQLELLPARSVNLEQALKELEE